MICDLQYQYRDTEQWCCYSYGWAVYFAPIKIIDTGGLTNLEAEQFTKADLDACHAFCGKGKARATPRWLSSTVRLSKNLITCL